MHFKQCTLKKGLIKTTTWLPDKYAKVNHFVKLKNAGQWDDGWEVIDVGTVLMDEKEVVERSQDYKNQRKASDV